jgi:arginine-tRNA-protein transferase
MADELPPMLYHAFMDAGFRRTGKLIYQPACRACRKCLPIRVPVEQFHPDKSQRRCRRRNSDLQISIDTPRASDEKFDLYSRYLLQWHGRSAAAESEPDDDEGNRKSFEAFLYDSPVGTIEFTYRDPAGQLLGVGICDVCSLSLSSVYFYFDPAHSERGLGTFGALYEIEHARSHHIPWYYLGYWVDGCASMQYKCGFRPCQVLHTDGTWRELQTDAGIGGTANV